MGVVYVPGAVQEKLEAMILELCSILHCHLEARPRSEFIEHVLVYLPRPYNIIMA